MWKNNHMGGQKKMKNLKIVLMLVLIGAFLVSCNNQIDEVDGESLVKEVWTAMKTANMDFLENILDEGFQSIHQDGYRDRAAELELIKNLNMGDYELDDFVVTRNANTMNVTYFVNVTETIEEETYTKRSARLTVFSKTPEGWKWISHANLLPLK